MLVSYGALKPDGTFPAMRNMMYQYVMAGNGVFVEARRQGLYALGPVLSGAIRGLPSLSPCVEFDAGPIPSSLILQMFTRFWVSRNEVLACFLVEQGRWVLRFPEQVATLCSVEPVNPYDSVVANALVEIHSHPGGLSVAPSLGDDEEETGFRVYGVASGRPGCFDIEFRAGVYGHTFRVPAGQVVAGLVGRCLWAA